MNMGKYKVKRIKPPPAPPAPAARLVRDDRRPNIPQPLHYSMGPCTWRDVVLVTLCIVGAVVCAALILRSCS